MSAAELINYQCAAYRRQSPHWRLLEDTYQGDTAWIDHQPNGSLAPTAKSRRYLPQEPGETDADYQHRLGMSHFSDKFAQAIRDFVGVVFNNGVRLVEVPDAIAEHWQTLNGAGMSGDRFAALLGLQALRLGHTFTLIDFPTHDPDVVSLADAQAADRHPFWVDLSPLQVINWRYRKVGNRQVLTMAVVQVQATEPEGRYGERERTYYIRYTPGRYDTFFLWRDRQNQIRQEWVPEQSGVMGRRQRGQLQPFDHIPLRCIYGGDRQGFFQSNPTLLSLAKLNIHHYQLKSDHRQKMHYCCFPTPVRVGGDGSDLVLGPRTIVDVSVGGSFGWSEPNANSLAMSRQDVQDTETEMDFLGADYIVKPGDRQAAMTSLMQATKIESQLYLFASDFALGLTECLSDHARYLGLDSGGRAELNAKFFDDISSDPQLLLALLQMRERDDLSREELRENAARKKFVKLPEYEGIN